VRCGLLQAEAEALNRGFISRMTRGVPWVRLKIAASLDGKTQEERRQLRLESDQHEIQILEKGGIGELARMPRGNGALPNAHQSTAKGQRRNIGKAGST